MQNLKFKSQKSGLKFGFFSLCLLLIIGGPAAALDNPEQKVTEAVRDYIVGKNPDWNRDDIRLEFKSAEKEFAEMGGLPEDSQIVILENYPDFRPAGNVIFPIAAKFASGEAGRKYLLRAKVEVIKQISVAAKPIKKGKMLEESDLKLEDRDVALLPNKYFVNDKLLAGKEAKITIPQNSTVFEWMVGDLPLFHRGDSIDLIVSGPSLAVKVKAQALDDGYLNSEIKVKRADSKKIVTAKVVSPNEVEVKL